MCTACQKDLSNTSHLHPKPPGAKLTAASFGSCTGLSGPHHTTPHHTTPHHTKPNHTTPHNIRPNQTTPLQTRPRQIRLDYTRQDHTRQDHTTPHHIRPDQTKPDLARSDYTTPNNTKPDQPRSYIRDQVIINLTLVLIYPNILYVVEKEIYISGITSIASVWSLKSLDVLRCGDWGGCDEQYVRGDWGGCDEQYVRGDWAEAVMNSMCAEIGQRQWWIVCFHSLARVMLPLLSLISILHFFKNQNGL